MRGRWTIVSLGCVLVCLGVSAQAQKPGGDPKARALKNPVPSSAASIKAGQAVYATNCRHCHGPRGKGDGTLAPTSPSPANLIDDQWDHGSTDGEIYTLILNGAPARPGQQESEMKPMKGVLTPTQIWQIVNYIRSIGPPPASAAVAPAKK